MITGALQLSACPRSGSNGGMTSSRINTAEQILPRFRRSPFLICEALHTRLRTSTDNIMLRPGPNEVVTK